MNSDASLIYYKSYRIIDGKSKLVIVNENGDVINKNPVKEELKCLEKERYFRNIIPKTKYNETDTCPIIREDTGKPCGNLLSSRFLEHDNNGKSTGRLICRQCYRTYQTYRTYNKPKKIYNDTNTCPKIKENTGRPCGNPLVPGNTLRERNKDWEFTGRYICDICYNTDRHRYDPNDSNNIRKSIANRRTGNTYPNSHNAKGDKSQELACIEFGWEDLNKKDDNYGSRIDCYDHKKYLFHQVRGKWYDPVNKCWKFGSLEREWHKEFEDMVLYCISNDGKRIERIYIIPHWEINERKGITIYKYNSIGIMYENGWYEQYRITNKEEIEKSNNIWESI